MYISYFLLHLFLFFKPSPRDIGITFFKETEEGGEKHTHTHTHTSV